MTEEVVLWSGRARRLLAQRASPPFGARGQSTKNLLPHSQAVEVFHLAMQQGLRSATSGWVAGKEAPGWSDTDLKQSPEPCPGNGVSLRESLETRLKPPSSVKPLWV